MATKKKVLRYTEEEFVTLLENIVKRVKKEQIVESRKKAARKKQLSENFDKLNRTNSTNKRKTVPRKATTAPRRRPTGRK